MDKLTVRDFDASRKRIFLRVDFNVPLEDGRVTDDSRIRAAIPTIQYLLRQNAIVILASHLGRPNGKVVESLRLRPVAERLSALIRLPVRVTGDALGIGTVDAIARLKPGQLLMLENLRFHAAEENNDPEFAKQLASYAEIYVNDAFGTAHRAHASTVGVAKLLPAYAGLLMEREIRMLSSLLEAPERPFFAVVGGAKVSGKIKVLEQLMERVDGFIVGGGMANTFIAAKGFGVGKSLLERDRIEDARRILETAESKGVQFLLPTDVVVAKEVTRGAEHKTVPATKIPNSWSVVDIGPATTAAFSEALQTAKTVLWNGPLGVFEVPTFGDGTRAMARLLAARADEGVTVVVGGGDSVAAVEQLGLAEKMTHISTGGGASLEFLEGRELPGIAVLQDRPAPEPKAPAKSASATRSKASAKATSSAAAAKAPTTAKSAKSGTSQPAGATKGAA
jgi:phosphoglycerate kinase